ncbi:MAG: M20/M25/M40 family metallo-hydrolase, partial [Lentilactobacillus parabuchneri]|nr:M20/M25/M40 family metallo-hydrolase [Lentilactobacillus parabuchneri]
MEDSEQIQILQHLISINSVNDHEADVAAYIQQLFADHGITSQVIPYADGRANIIAEIGDTTSDQVFALAGHLDTVATGDVADWKFDPFSAHIVDNQLYGRGAADMKSGLAAMVITLINLADHQTPLTGRLRFIGTVGEENGA